MSRTLSEYIAQIEILRKVGKSLEEAIGVAEIPAHLQAQVQSYFRGPVAIDPPDAPDLILQAQTLELCASLTDGAPQPYWNAFRAFLESERRWSRPAIGRLSETSELLVCRLPKPTQAKAFQCRGLVVGHIQSGKTANMAALIAKAADQGYRLFIVLAGIMKDLRAQTQRRMDQEITGISDDPLRDAPLATHDKGTPRWDRLSVSGLEGDFQPGTIQSAPNLDTPKLVVIKKNPAVLSRLTKWLGSSQMNLALLPALIIDDEADQASINTNYNRFDDAGEELDPSKTNDCIRELLRALPKCCYVGFTATPFANVLIDMTVSDDLYPKDFIASLPEPEGYFGPRQLFGLGGIPSDLTGDQPQKPPLDVIRDIPHDQLDLMDGLAAGAPCPELLSDALLTFVLSCCGRLARGHDNHHFSMLVHPSSRTGTHNVFREVLAQEVSFFRRAVAGGTRSFPDFAARARRLWEHDFLPLSQSQAVVPGWDQAFDTVWRHARAIIESLELKTLNFGSPDILDYSGVPKRYVVVGGNRLSRGLTLEGLSVSVFTRDGNAYDTLLQMGRWFGFRPGYQDLTRIFVEDRLASLFSDLARVELDLRSDLSKYARQPGPPTPSELAPRIRAHPSLAVTSRLKMGAGRLVAFSFQNTVQSTVNFPTADRGALLSNIEAGKTLLADLGKPSKSVTDEGMHVWTGVPAERVLGFLKDYTFGKNTPTVNRRTLSLYITKQIASGSLATWDVVVPRGNPNRAPFNWTHRVLARRVLRSPTSGESIGVLSSPGDIQQWRQEAGRKHDDPSVGCLMLYLVDKDSGDGKRALFTHLPDLLGLVLVFPSAPLTVMVDYVSQQDQ